MPTLNQRFSRNKRRRRRRRRLRTRRRGKTGRVRRRLPRIRRALPSAYQKQFRSSFRMNQSQSGMICSGKDLVATLPYNILVNEQYNCFAAFPCNPCYWTGTRVAAIASAYQNYRPLSISFHYVPQVSVNTPGTVLVGTLWNSPSSTDTFEQSMVTSNGGNMSQCYVPFSSHIALGRNLPQRMFNCAGNLDVDRNPFFFLAMMRGSDVVPGYFFVSYKFEFRNPLGYNLSYTTSLVKAPDWGEPRPDRSAICLNGIPRFAGPGLIVDVEANGDTLYHGTLINIPVGTSCMVYTSAPALPVNSNPQYRVSNVIVTDRAVEPNTPIDTLENFALFLNDTGQNLAKGTYLPQGDRAWGWEADRTSNKLKGWLDRAGGTTDFFYDFDPATFAMGALINQSKLGAGNRLSPSVVFDLLEQVSVYALPERALREFKSKIDRDGSDEAAQTESDIDVSPVFTTLKQKEKSKEKKIKS